MRPLHDYPWYAIFLRTVGVTCLTVAVLSSNGDITAYVGVRTALLIASGLDLYLIGWRMANR